MKKLLLLTISLATLGTLNIHAMNKNAELIANLKKNLKIQEDNLENAGKLHRPQMEETIANFKNQIARLEGQASTPVASRLEIFKKDLAIQESLLNQVGSGMRVEVQKRIDSLKKAIAAELEPKPVSSNLEKFPTITGTNQEPVSFGKQQKIPYKAPQDKTIADFKQELINKEIQINRAKSTGMGIDVSKLEERVQWLRNKIAELENQ